MAQLARGARRETWVILMTYGGRCLLTVLRNPNFFSIFLITRWRRSKTENCSVSGKKRSFARCQNKPDNFRGPSYWEKCWPSVTSTQIKVSSQFSWTFCNQIFTLELKCRNAMKNQEFSKIFLETASQNLKNTKAEINLPRFSRHQDVTHGQISFRGHGFSQRIRL